MPRVGPPRELLRTAPRIIIVRDPYDRLLSGYLDKIVMQKIARLAPKPYKIGDGFAAFVGNLTQRPPEEANVHWRPQALQCGMDRGLSYDYVLPVEEMHRWYEPLVRVLGLVRTVSHGWNHSTRWFAAATSAFTRLPGGAATACFRVQGVFDGALSTAARSARRARRASDPRASTRPTRRICRATARTTPRIRCNWPRSGSGGDLEALGYPVRT